MQRINPHQIPKISVIVPAFRPTNFDALRRSIDDNANVNTEWIVIDDGSGPTYNNVFEGLKTNGVQVTTLAKNGGQAAARNVGLAAARADWVKFLDADDRLDIGHLSALFSATEALASNEIAFAPTRHVYVNGTSMLNSSWRNLEPSSNDQFNRQLVRPFLHHCGALFPRQLLRELGGYDETLITDEDGDLLLRILMTGVHFTPVDKVNYLYIHHEGDNRVSSDDDIRKLQSRCRVCEKVKAAFGGQMPDPVREALAQRMDKIAMTYWSSHRKEAQELIEKAKVICPDYVPDMRPPLRLLRRLGGPSAMFAATAIYRRMKGLPKGGAQG